jgi:glycosyltransferase involved in cell wall biosynthesis
VRLAIVGPVFPYRAGIAYCTTRLAEELRKSHDVSIHSFSRQFPGLFYPGGDDRDPTLESKTPRGAKFSIDVMNPWTWLREGLRLRKERPDAVIFTWWVWVWALPYLVMRAFLPRGTRVVYQCHNISDKEPSSWKSWLTTRALASADLLVIHARSEAEEARRRLGRRREPLIVEIFLPVHEMGGAVPSRAEARAALGVAPDRPVALFFGHVRPFKALDVVLDAWPRLRSDALLLVSGEVWYGGEAGYREQAARLGLDDRRVRFDFRFIPDSEIATWFSAADVVLAPYRHEAQSGVVLTSFHFGRPVIATRVGGMPEIVEHGANGLLIEPESPEALAAAIDRFVTTSDRIAMEQAAAASAQRYSWHEFALRLMQALHS